MAKSNRKVSVDLTGVESFTRCPEGDWLAKVAKIEMTTVQGSGDDALRVTMEVIKGAAKSNSVIDTFSLSEKALWKLKQFLEALGMKANGKLKLDLDKIEDKICMISVVHTERDNKKYANVNEYFKPTDDDEDESDDEDYDDDEEDEDEEPAPKKGGKKTTASKSSKSKKKPEPEDEDEDDEDDEDDEEETPKPKKSSKKATPKKGGKKTSKKKPEPEDDDEDDDDDWEEDDD